MRESVGKDKAAGFCGRGGFGMDGEASKPLLYDNMISPAMQEPIYANLRAAYQRARLLAVRHLTLSERFLTEAERLGELLFESEAEL